MASYNTCPGIISFPKLFKPQPRSQGGEPVYSCALIVLPEHQKSKEWLAIQEAVKQAAIDEFGAKVVMSALNMPFRDAAEKEGQYEGYEKGRIVINPWTKNKPGVVGPRLEDILSPDEVFAGQIVRLNVTPFAWTNSGKKGVSLGLNHVQILKPDAPRIDGRAPANKAFTEDTSMVDEDIPF